MQHAPQNTHVTKTTAVSEERLIDASKLLLFFFFNETFPHGLKLNLYKELASAIHLQSYFVL